MFDHLIENDEELPYIYEVFSESHSIMNFGQLKRFNKTIEVKQDGTIWITGPMDPTNDCKMFITNIN